MCFKRLQFYFIFTFLLISNYAFSQVNVKNYNSEIALKWNKMYLALDTKAPGFRPASTSSAAGYINFAAYEAVIQGMPDYLSLAPKFPNLVIPATDSNKVYNWPLVLNNTYNYMLKQFFGYMSDSHPLLFSQIDSLYQVTGDSLKNNLPLAVINNSETHGNAVATAVYTWFATDPFAHNAWLNPNPPGYVPSMGPGLWQPTPPDFTPAAFPYYGEVRTFALPNHEKLALPPLKYKEEIGSPLRLEAEEVANSVNKIKNKEAGYEDMEWMAHFWSDDITGFTISPPARVIAIANQLAELENLDLEKSLELYAKSGLAMHDAAVAIWYSKYFYNIERPVDYIQRVLSLTDPSLVTWTSILDNTISGFNGVTPSFPAYPSGHSGFGGVMSGVFSSFFENNDQYLGNYTFTDRTHEGRTDLIGSAPRTFSSFREMGFENAISRIPLGVHFRMDCVEGFRLGELVAKRVLELDWKKPVYNCDSINILLEDNKVVFCNLEAPLIAIQIMDMNNNWIIVYNQILTSAQDTFLVDSLPAGEYFYKVDLMDLSYQAHCSSKGEFVIDSLIPSSTIGTFASSKNVSIYPNPASNQAYVKMDSFKGQEAFVEIVNALGVVLKSQNLGLIQEDSKELDIKGLENGLYSLRFVGEKGRSNAIKLVIKK